ncbi:MAG: hypothetical protein JNL88_03340 [Bacteroidia bacterium]|nr:hypothetical protein [Bacteroidia bacterium]
MNYYSGSLWLALILFFHPDLLAQNSSSKPLIHGYIKDLQSLSFEEDASTLRSMNLFHNRLNFRWDISSEFTARLEARNRLFYGDQLKSMPGFGKQVARDEGLFSLTKLWVNEPALVLTSTFDRASLKYSKGQIGITMGRQRVNWGVNTIWNPMDIFNAYNFLDFDYEERPGSDAIRMQYFSSGFSAFELAYAAADRGRKHTAAALFKFNKWKYDFQVMGGMLDEDLTAGMAWAGNIKEAGFKGEVSAFRKIMGSEEGRDVLTYSVMADYSFKSSWYVSAAFLYIDNPLSVTSFMQASGAVSVSAKNLMPFRWSFYSGLQKMFNPVFSANVSIVYSPEKNSVILFPALAYSLADNLNLDLTAQSFFAQEKNRYVTEGTTLFLRFRWSF